MVKLIRWLIILSLLLIPAGSAAGQAQPAAPDAPVLDGPVSGGPLCYSLDVVFLIDQSGSMSGESGYPANDPLGNRFEAPRYAMDWLANNRLGLCPNSVHHIGVVSFGGTAQVDLPFSAIEPGNQDQWDVIRPEMASKIRDRNMGATDPILAFEQAKALFDANPPQGNSLRRRAIVLLTDGQPCVSGVGCSYDPKDPVNIEYINRMLADIRSNFTFSEKLKAQDNALNQALLEHGSFDAIPEEQLAAIFDTNPVSAEEIASSTYLYIVAMNSSTPYLNNVKEKFEEITREYGGQLVDLENNLTAVPRQFNEIISRLAGVTPQITGCGAMPVNPYLSGAVLDIFKIADGLEVVVKFDGKSLTRGQGDKEFFHLTDYGEFGAVEHYRFVQPPAGLWQIDAANCSGLEAALIPFRAKFEQLAPLSVVPNYNAGGQAYDSDHPEYLLYKISDQETGKPLNLDEEYPLVMKAAVTAPDGSTTVLDMEFVSEGQWKSVQPIPVNQMGTYMVDVNGRAPCVADPQRPSRCPEPDFEVVRDSSGKYTTGNVDPFTVTVLEPQEGTNIPLHGSLIPQGLKEQPIRIRLQLQDKSGKVVPVSEILTGGNASALDVSLNADGQTIPVSVTPIEDGSLALTGEVMGPSFNGDHTLTVKIKPDGYDFTKIHPSNIPQIINFTRSDPFWQNPNFWKIVWIVLGLILLGLLAKLIYERSNPVRGSLQFVSSAGNYNLSINTGWRKSVIRGTHPILKKLGIKRLQAVRTGYSNQRAQIQVVINPAVGNQQTMNLVDNAIPGMFGTFQVIYTGGGMQRATRPPRRAPGMRRP